LASYWPLKTGGARTTPENQYGQNANSTAVLYRKMEDIGCSRSASTLNHIKQTTFVDDSIYSEAYYIAESLVGEKHQ